MFALTDVDLFESVNLKVEPEVGAELRDKYGFVREAYHMNKKHWITVFVGEGVSDKLLMSWIDTSYQLVTNGLTKSQKLTLDT